MGRLKDSMIDHLDEYEWGISPTEDMSGIGIPQPHTWSIEVDNHQLSKDLGPDVIQKIDIILDQLGGRLQDEIPF
tara:strand:+ start:779 stop:1003 length:225 start_codon:yes stop_codon:yes gene_type:complete